ncbi:hypothetical protein GCM10010289_72990 [Streptomyces violascens]|nr:hypothetical protein GCM10010289_72990 [Streptomyces violascens]
MRRLLAANVVAWRNDIFSFYAEKNLPGAFWNLPGVYQAHGAGQDEAMHHSAHDVQTAVEEFQHRESRLADTLTPAQATHIASCKQWMRGVHDWSYEVAERYVGGTNCTPEAPCSVAERAGEGAFSVSEVTGKVLRGGQGSRPPGNDRHLRGCSPGCGMGVQVVVEARPQGPAMAGALRPVCLPGGGRRGVQRVGAGSVLWEPAVLGRTLVSSRVVGQRTHNPVVGG